MPFFNKVKLLVLSNSSPSLLFFCSGRQYRTANIRSTCAARSIYSLDMLLKAPEMDIQFMQMLQKSSERGSCRHLSEGINIFREAFTTITEFTIWPWYLGVGVVDIT